MTLFYKSWRESRTRFVAGVIAIAAYSIFQAAFPPSSALAPDAYWRYIETQFFASTGGGMFILLVIFLGSDGLLREVARHTALFTLSLPVSRARLVRTQVAVGLAEVAAFAFIPSVLVGPLAALTHQSYPIDAAVRHCLPRLFCGFFIFATSVLFASFVRSPYLGPFLSYVALFVQNRIAESIEKVRPFILNPMATVNGRWGFERTHSIYDPLPWTGLVVMLVMTFGFFVISTRIMERRSL